MCLCFFRSLIFLLMSAIFYLLLLLSHPPSNLHLTSLLSFFFPLSLSLNLLFHL